MAKISEYLGNFLLIILIIQFLPVMFNTIKKYYSSVTEPRAQVGYMPIKGTLTDSTFYVKELKKLFENREVKAILLKIDSPGGYAGTSQALFSEINALKKEHPKTVVALVENVCASGSYYVACAADYIISTPSAFLGSIGAYLSFPELTDFIEQYKVHWKIIKSGDYKTAGNPVSPLSKEAQEMLQGVSDDTYNRFTQDVAQRRPKLSLKNVSEWANGRIFTGDQALRIGLIDEVGSLSNAIQKIKEKEAIEGEIEWVKSAKPGPLARLFGSDDETGENESFASSIVNSLWSAFEQRAAVSCIR